MRYSSDHKEKSKERILEAGRRLFRQHGFEGASIDEVMNAAGLTRGAFMRTSHRRTISCVRFSISKPAWSRRCSGLL